MRALLMILAVIALAAVGTVAEQKSPAPAKASAAKATTTSPVNLNTATQAQLETLPGVGAKAAQRILEYRQKNGNVKKIEEIIAEHTSSPTAPANYGMLLNAVEG